MKAWWVYDRTALTWARHIPTGEEVQTYPGIYVPAETRGKARMYGVREMDIDFTDVGVRRAPEHDGKTSKDFYELNWSDREWEV